MVICQNNQKLLKNALIMCRGPLYKKFGVSHSFIHSFLNKGLVTSRQNNFFLTKQSIFLFYLLHYEISCCHMGPRQLTQQNGPRNKLTANQMTPIS